MLAIAIAALALAAAQQPAEDDGPVRTALAERPADRAETAPPPAAKPVDERKTPPAAVAAAKTLAFEPKTLVDGATLQVILGQRAIFRLDDKDLPVLAKVEEGRLAAAHPEGAVTETFEPPPKGQVAAALDGSAEKHASVLKVWNGLGRAVDYRAIGLVLRTGKLTPAALAVCAVPPGGMRTETWPRAVVAVGLSHFRTTPAAANCKTTTGG